MTHGYFSWRENNVRPLGYRCRFKIWRLKYFGSLWCSSGNYDFWNDREDINSIPTAIILYLALRNIV